MRVISENRSNLHIDEKRQWYFDYLILLSCRLRLKPILTQTECMNARANVFPQLLYSMIHIRFNNSAPIFRPSEQTSEEIYIARWAPIKIR